MKLGAADLESLAGLALLLALTLLSGEEDGVDVGDDTSVSNGDIGKELVELLVVADGEHDVTGHNADLLVVARGVTGELEDLSGQVLEDGSEVDGSTDTDAAGILALAELAVETANGEGEASASRARALTSLLGGSSLLGSGGSLLTTSRHVNLTQMKRMKDLTDLWGTGERIANELWELT